MFLKRIFSKLVHIRRNFSSTDRHAGENHSPITKYLWELRAEENKREIQWAQAKILTKNPAESTVSVNYDFHHDSSLRDKYANPWGFVRLGKLLEDLDALAGTVAWKHCDDGNPDTRPLLIVTASVDRIEMMSRIFLNSKMTMHGRVVWAGKSSMEIKMKIDVPCQVDPLKSKPALVANFAFVARDALTNKAAMINRLEPLSDEEHTLWEEGATKAKMRKIIRKQKLTAVEIEETNLKIQELISESKLKQDMPSLSDDNAILMSQTSLGNAMMTQPQNRNMYGRVFGGFLMRRAFELAFSTAYLFSGSRPMFKAVDEVQFHRPVDVGSLLRFKSYVLYSEMDASSKPVVHIEITASVTRPEQRTSSLSNTFYFTFEYDKKDMVANGNHRLKRVLPGTETEARKYLEHLKQNQSNSS